MRFRTNDFYLFCFSYTQLTNFILGLSSVYTLANRGKALNLGSIQCAIGDDMAYAIPSVNGCDLVRSKS